MENTNNNEVKHLSKVVDVDKEKCVNCHACIAACPVKFCNDASGDTVLINDDLCIGCGACILACTHEARKIVDDTSAFFNALYNGKSSGEGFIALVAPAIVANFPDTYLNINGFLKSQGVKAVFDVSFGGELTSASYVNYIKQKKPQYVIAQPCPAIVSYIETYQPSLISYLAPADSPMLHCVKMVREYYPEYADCKVAAISPCIAKRREFDETGFIDYNVTFVNLKALLKERGLDLSSFPKDEYDNPPAERAVTFSMPGGLRTTADRDLPGIRRRTRKIEGVESVYPYLENTSEVIAGGALNEGYLPLLVDCLSCEQGCNGGTGTDSQDVPRDKLELPIWKRREEMEHKYGGNIGKKNNKSGKKFQKLLKKYWKTGLYDRHYTDNSKKSALKIPNEAELTEVYKQLNKFGQEDMYDCNTCGYGSCYKMALAIFNGLNRKENCHHYNLDMVDHDKEELRRMNDELKGEIAKSLNYISNINSAVEELNRVSKQQAQLMDKSSDAVEEMMKTITETSVASKEKLKGLNGLVEDTEKGQTAMHETIDAVKHISDDVEGISGMIKEINAIAANTNLLSMNAAIEASHAGEAGKGFAVVAEEIRRLSDSTHTNAQSIGRTLRTIVEGVNSTSTRSAETEALINHLSEEIHGFAETISSLISNLSELGEGSEEVTKALDDLTNISSEVKKSHSNMMEKTKELAGAMDEIAKVADGD
ncbi:MAG: methyl-accepting chemotaxis protein [Spirochaetaceae bacterium]|jgi:iron only hydrogenase large subunit-like protein/uncharacterized protein YoxC|nr:methyl-accepting chemotaxis protein [Spirochaetaceae bacterium]